MTKLRKGFLTLSGIAIAAFAMSSSPTWAKGGGVGYWLEGTVSNVSASGNHVQLLVTGRFWLVQYPDGRPPARIVEFKCDSGIPVTLSQATPFYAMSTDWGGGALRKLGTLFQILKSAASRGNVVKFQLLEPRVDFAAGDCPALTSAVARATDADLK